MKCFRKLLSLALAIGLVAGMLPGRAAAAGQTIQVSDGAEFLKALKTANDGDTIQITQEIVVVHPDNNESPLVIGKKLTITGELLTLRTNGIILGKDVTFRDIKIAVAGATYYSFLANGHTLTLENVSQGPSSSNISVFCGGLEDPLYPNLPTPGSNGRVIIKGNTKLGGNFYAGSLFPKNSTGASSTYSGTSEIYMQSTTSDQLGAIYASGAAKIGDGTPDPTADSDKYPFSGSAIIELGKSGSVQGQAASNNFATVVYSGGGNEGVPSLQNIGDLRVERGNLNPNVLTFGVDSPNITIQDGARLNLSKLDKPVNDFSGGGQLVLGASQTLTINGDVSGSTQVGIGSISANNESLNDPAENHPYIKTSVNTADDSFVLLPYRGNPNMRFEKSAAGEWMVEKGAPPVLLVESLRSELPEIQPGAAECVIPLNPTYVENGAPVQMLVMIDLGIAINGTLANWDDGFGIYHITLEGISYDVEITEDDELLISRSASFPLF